jgi:hypothetical protein
VNPISTPGQPRLLIRQISDLEKQLAARRRNVRLQLRGIREQVTLQLITPGVLLAAVGVGVTLEQSNRLKFWSVATLLNAINASMGLLHAFKYPDSSSR